MTTNQIEFMKLKETERANREREAETKRKNTADIFHDTATRAEVSRNNVVLSTLSAKRDAETARSNLAKEVETNRSNLAKEDLESKKLAETARSNLANEAIKEAANVETHRSNVAKETETNRHNVVSEQNDMTKHSQSLAATAELQAKQHQFDQPLNTAKTVGTWVNAAKTFIDTLSPAKKAGELLASIF